MSLILKNLGQGNVINPLCDAMQGNLSIIIEGNNNRIEFDPNVKDMSLKIVMRGDNNTVKLASKACLKNSSLLQIEGSDNAIILGADCSGRMDVQCHTSGACLNIGQSTTFFYTRFTFHEPNRRIQLGRDCMLSVECWFTVSDMHSIIDRATGQRINPAADIVLGDHVWLGRGATILKGAEIGSGSVIGTRAVVTGRIPKNCVAVGVPAKVVRTNIAWSRALVSELQPFSATTELPI